jgi:flagellar motor switch protein FliG
MQPAYTDPLGSRAALSPAQKLAAILLILGEEPATLILRRFDDYERELVSSAMVNLPLLTADQQVRVLNEFSELAIKARVSVSGSSEFTQAVLEKSVGMFKAAEVMARLGGKRVRIPVASLQRLMELDSHGLANLLKEEQTSTVAMILGHMPSSKAADVLALLPEMMRDGVVERLATLSPTPMEVLETVGDVLARKASCQISRSSPPAGGVKSAAAILNSVDKSIREDVLGRIDGRTPELVRSIKNNLFIFDDLVRLDNRTLQRILREVDGAKLAVALSAADEGLRDKFLGSLSKRAADMVRDEMSYLGKVGRREITRAQDLVMEIARRLETEGEVVLDAEG